MLIIETKFTGRQAILESGFRLFFLLAASAAALLMGLWFGLFNFSPAALQPGYSPLYWHAHEMLFGFALAPIAGFLLTAVRNWTGRTTLVGKPLLLLALPWLLARLAAFSGEFSPWIAAVFECLFLAGLALVIGKPILLTKQWAQLGIVSKVILLLPASLAFHLGVAGYWAPGTLIGLNAALYIILALVVTLVRRVMPLFIERGLNNGFVPRNSALTDRWGLVVFLLFALVDTAFQVVPDMAALAPLSAMLAAVLCLLHGARLSAWYHRQIWGKPLVWVLFLAYAWVVLGFLLKALQGLGVASHSLAIHAFAAGGIGLATLGMMARISLGHTDRNVNQPPRAVTAIFLLVFLAAVCRVGGPLLLPAVYLFWIIAAQISWSAGFLLFVHVYYPILTGVRTDALASP
jgi:uncharacterized protein involved in response to NO